MKLSGTDKAKITWYQALPVIDFFFFNFVLLLVKYICYVSMKVQFI